jgi:predicted ArsR family transcriptional regulator
VMIKSGANIRHHLSILVSNDVIEIVGKRKEGRGRPKQVYGLSRRVLGDGLDVLSENLLEMWKESLPEEKLEEVLKSLATRLAGPFEFGGSELKRVERTVEKMNGLRYHARWEAGAAGARIILGHCPYAAIILKHPELCQMDGLLLETTLGAPVKQITKLQISSKGLPFCAFQMVKNGDSVLDRMN